MLPKYANVEKASSQSEALEASLPTVAQAREMARQKLASDNGVSVDYYRNLPMPCTTPPQWLSTELSPAMCYSATYLELHSRGGRLVASFAG